MEKGTRPIRCPRWLRNTALTACAALLLAPSLSAAEPPASRQTSEFSTPFLWAITSPGAKTSFLFGTIHLSRSAVTDFPVTVVNAMKAADAVYTEIPMDLETMLTAMQKFLMTDGETLSTVVPPDLLADVQAELRRINPALDLAPFERFQVWALAATLSLLEDQIKEGGKPAQDTLIFQRAAMAHKEAGGLETVDEQLAIFSDLTRDQQIAMLRDTITQIRELRRQGKSPIDELAAIYLGGNLDALASYTEKWMRAGDNPALNNELMERLLYRRNEHMATRITAKMREHPQKSYFFAIGAAHLYGPRGLVALLQKAGFTLHRVPPTK